MVSPSPATAEKPNLVSPSLTPAKSSTPSTKRASPQQIARQTKKARLTVDSSETTQVTSLDQSLKLPFADGEVFYVSDFIAKRQAQEWYNELLKIEGWYQPKLKMYGKEITQSRKIAAYATDPSLVVKYSGTTVDMQYDYPPLLKQIQEQVEEKLGVKFNHVMLNLYEDGKVYIGNHRDNKENRVIASLSLGAQRTFIMTHTSPPPQSTQTLPESPFAAARTPSQPIPTKKSEKENSDSTDKIFAWKGVLANGSLIVMQGQTQQYWKHEIPKELKVKEGRISLTFRQLVF